MASGLAAAIRDIFGITPRLVEGHNGIYEVSVEGHVVASNQGKCSGTPTENDVLSAVRKYKNPLPGKEKMIKTTLPLI